MKKKITTFKVLAVLISILLAAVLLLVLNANRILKYELEKSLDRHVSAESIELGWDKVRALHLSVLRPDGTRVLSADELILKGSVIGFLRGEKIVSLLVLESPRLLIEIDSAGTMVPLARTEERKKDDHEKPAKGFLVQKLVVQDGALDYLDRKVGTPPALIPLRDIRLDINNVSLPSDNLLSAYAVTAAVPGKLSAGTMRSTGTVNLRTRDAKSSLTIRNLDLTLLKPYFQKKEDVEVSRGTLSMDADIRITSSQLQSSGKITIRDLDFKPGESKRFLGLPLFAVMNLLKNGNNEIILDFTLEGDLNNPRFSIRDSLIRKATLSLARLLGLPVEVIGRSVVDIGREALQRIFR